MIGKVNAANVIPSSTYTLTGQPQHGSVTVSTDGAYRYVPTVSDRLAAGAGTSPVTDEFTVTVDDGHGSPDWLGQPCR